MITYLTNKLQKVLLSGGCEQRNLPSEYEELEYISTENGSGPFINTGIKAGSKTRVVAKYKLFTVSFTSPVSVRDVAQAGAGYGFGVNDSQQFISDYNGSRKTFANITPNTTDVITVDKNRNVCTITISGQSETVTNTASTFETNGTLVFFGQRSDGNVSVARYSFYSFKLWTEDVLVLDLVPARRLSDNELGFYNKVNGGFLTNAGTGTFAAGADVVPTPDTPVDIVCNNGVLKVRHQSGLPFGYTLLDYIGSSGTQYIKTGIKPASGYKVRCKYIRKGTSSSPSAPFGCTSEANASNALKGIYRVHGATNRVAYGNGSGTTLNVTGYNDFGQVYDIICNAGVWTINGTEIGTIIPATWSADYDIWLFARNTGGTVGLAGSWQIMLCQIWDKNGNLIFDCLPCKNSSNVLGMFDLVSQTFLTNQGTGTFTAGADVDDMEIYTDGTTETVEITGKNLYNPAENTYGYYIDANGVIQVSSAHDACYTGYIRVKPSTQYTLSLVSSRINTIRIHNYNANKEWISQAGYKATTTVGETFTLTITTARTVKYARLSLVATHDDLQFELGSTATPYEPYFNGGTATAENLFKVGNYQDVQSVIDGKVTRNVGIKVLDGTENWSIVNINYADGTHRIYTNDFGCDENITSTHFVGAPIEDRDLREGQQGKMYYNAASLHLRATQFTSLAVAKQWLADQYTNGTPVIIVYPLATPTTEQVTSQPLAGSTATVTAGSIDNLSIESSTIAELNERYIGDKEVKRVYIGGNLVYNTNKVHEKQAKFYYRKTGGTQSVDSGIATIKEIRGKSLVWNQILDNTSPTNVESGFTVASTSEPNKYAVTVIDTLTDTTSICQLTNVFVNRLHKFYVGITSDSKFLGIRNSQVGDFYSSVILYTPTSLSSTLILRGRAGLEAGTYNIRLIVIDLTLMFGTGNEPATVEEFEKMFPLDYYDYNAGEIIPFAGQNLTTTDKNQYNNATGKANLLGGQTYQLLGTYTSAEIDGVAVTLDSNNCFTTTKDCVLDVTGGNDTDTIVALYNGENVTFEPYEKHTLPLDPSQWRDNDGNLVFPYGGMHGVGNIYDYARVDADGYIRKAMRRFNQVDLGSLNWLTYTPVSEDRPYGVFSTATLNIGLPVIEIGQTGTFNAVNTKYITGNRIDSWTRYSKTNKIIYRAYDAGLQGYKLAINDSSFTDKSSFINSLNGVMLIYELAEPVEIELATPIYAKYLVDKDGTEEITPANGSTPYTTMTNLHLVYSRKIS